MNVKVKRVLLAWFLSLLFIISMAGMSYAYSGILAFGDSLSDNGTGAGDPYGFRRYSNGSVWVDYLASSSHFNAPVFDLAYGGATTAWDNPAAFNSTKNPIYQTTTGLQWQVAQYTANYSTIAANTLVTLWAGGNDMFNSRSPVTAAQNIGTAIQNLIAIGGREFLVPNLGYSDTDPYKLWKQPFDLSLALVLSGLRAANAGVHIYGVDMNGLVMPASWIPASQGTYLNPNGHTGIFVSWDGVHPTTEAHQLIANYTASAVPIPAPFILILTGLAGIAAIKKRFKL